MTPYQEPLTIPFRDKAFRVKFSHLKAAKAERVLGLNILYMAEPNIFKQPWAYQLGCWLFVLIHDKFDDVTLDECIEVANGEKREHYMDAVAKLIKNIQPLLMEMNGAGKEVDQVAAPLAESNGGESDGPPPESSFE